MFELKMGWQWLALGASITLLLAACGGGDDDVGADEAPTWEEGAATARVERNGQEITSFDGGTCERGTTSTGKDSFVLGIGEVGKDGNGISVRIGLDLTGGATFPGDGSGNGVQVNFAGFRYGLALGDEAILFDDDLGGGTIQIADEDDTSKTANVQFTC